MFKKFHIFSLSCLSVALLSFSSMAQSTDNPIELQEIYACKTKTNPTDRLNCYDQAVSRFEAAQNSGSVVTVSKSQVEKVEREAFGFNIPSLPSLGGLFGRSKTSVAVKENKLIAPVGPTKVITPPTQSKVGEQVAELPNIREVTPVEPTNLIAPKPSDVTSVKLVIKKTAEFGYKKTRFFFDNGQVWEQVDNNTVRIPKVRNKTPNTAKISKAALGSFFLRVNEKGRAIRVRRVR